MKNLQEYKLEIADDLDVVALIMILEKDDELKYLAEQLEKQFDGSRL
jgi:hypothetical protein